jgi:O-acetylserine/cysteine efflux transporter
MPMSQPTARDLINAAGVALIWGVNFVVIKVGLEGTAPLLLASARFVLVAALTIWWVPRPSISWPLLIGISSTMYVGQFGLLFSAISSGMPAGLAAVVLQIQAVFTLVGAMVFLRERPAPIHIAGVVVALGGLVLVGADAFSRLNAAGFILSVAAGLAWAIGNLLTRRVTSPQGLGVVAWGSLIEAPALWLVHLLVDGAGHDVATVSGWRWAGYGSLVYLAVLATIVGYGVWTSLLSRLPASKVSPFALLVPPVGLAAAWLLLGERESRLALAGSAVVVLGLALPHLVTWLGRLRA